LSQDSQRLGLALCSNNSQLWKEAGPLQKWAMKIVVVEMHDAMTHKVVELRATAGMVVKVV
jgi:hypothetical protein